VTAPAALATRGINIITDTLGGTGQPRMAQAYQHVTDTGGDPLFVTDNRGAAGQPDPWGQTTTIAPTSAEDAQRYAPGWRPSTGQPGSSGSASLPYAYGGLSTSVETVPGWTAHPSTKPYIYGGAPPAVAQAGSGFYRAHLSAPVVTTTGGDAFNWGDAGLGAVTGFGALFLLAGSAMLVRRRNTLAI
jgi:hypothetical protein